MKTYNHVKGWALGLAFKKKPKLIQKWVFNNYENYFKNTLTKPSQDTNLGSNQGIIEISNFFFTNSSYTRESLVPLAYVDENFL